MGGHTTVMVRAFHDAQLRGAREWEDRPMTLTNHIITLPTHRVSDWPSPWKLSGTRPLMSAQHNPMFGKCVVKVSEDT